MSINELLGIEEMSIHYPRLVRVAARLWLPFWGAGGGPTLGTNVRSTPRGVLDGVWLGLAGVQAPKPGPARHGLGPLTPANARQTSFLNLILSRRAMHNDLGLPQNGISGGSGPKP